jgi:putative transposase
MFINEGISVRKVLSILQLSPSCFYYQIVAESDLKPKGILPSLTTKTHLGKWVDNSILIDEIRTLLSTEFVDYGYFKVTHYLKIYYVINHKKVYRLMKINKLLFKSIQCKVGTKNWVTELVPQPVVAFSYWEFDIKFMYVTGLGIYIPMLTVIDVKSRWVLGYLCQKSIKKEDVKLFMDIIITTYKIPEKIEVRCDNGSQFESNLIRQYFIEKGIKQEFTKPATPEQNAHIESYHSIVEKVICKQYAFETEKDQLNTLKRWVIFYNYERIHSGTNYTSPYQNLLKSGIDVNQLFKKADIENECIFIALNEKEMGNAGVQPIRDNLTDQNKNKPQNK